MRGRSASSAVNAWFCARDAREDGVRGVREREGERESPLSLSLSFCEDVMLSSSLPLSLSPLRDERREREVCGGGSNVRRDFSRRSVPCKGSGLAERSPARGSMVGFLGVCVCVCVRNK